MKSRKELVEFLVRNFPMGQNIEEGSESIAEALINEGFLEVKVLSEPIEFNWCVECGLPIYSGQLHNNEKHTVIKMREVE